jgi:thiamine biosynthesis lipoprotein
LSLVAWALLAIQPIPSTPADSLAVREAWVMGTRVRVSVEAPSGLRAAALGELVVREIERIDRLLSTWDDGSALSQLNGARPGFGQPVASELLDLLTELDAWSRTTGNAFEPRVGSLVDVWDLRGPGSSPTRDQVERALGASRPGAIVIENGTLTRTSDAAWIDSGAFGKGAALRSVATLVAASDGPSPRILVDLGGQLLVAAPQHNPWVVDVAHPFHRAVVAARLRVTAGSVATSGTSERGRHILDPRTGGPVEAWGSVTVVHDDPLAADILSTALFVMGPEGGRAWAEEAGVRALFLVSDGDTVRSEWTSAATTSHRK